VGYKNVELKGVATSRDVIASWNIALKATEVEARYLEGV
jgi:transposase